MTVIQEELLRHYGASRQSYDKDNLIFGQGEKARFYYEVIYGEVKMCNYNAEGREFIQGIFSAGRSFGEPALFGDFPYPAHAIALRGTEVWQLPANDFYELLKEHPEVHFKITSQIAARLHYKAIMAQEMSHSDAASRILKLLRYLKYEVYGLKEPYSYRVELTRQQIADLTGLRVETVIRSIKNLAHEDVIRIYQRKIMI